MDSQTYWKNREMEQRKHNIRDEKEYQKHIQEIYQNMIDEIEESMRRRKVSRLQRRGNVLLKQILRPWGVRLPNM